MVPEEAIAVWLRRAHSSLAKARMGRADAAIILEDLCYDAQQAAEKALKALCLAKGIQFPRTHNIGQLLSILADRGIQPPADLGDADELTVYAVAVPGDWEPIGNDEYEHMIEIAARVLSWVEGITGEITRG